MFQVHKKGFVPGRKRVDGLVPYDFFCEDNPAINLFMFTGPNQNGTQSVKFQRVLKIIKHASNTRKVDYEILTDEGDTYFTRPPVAKSCAQTVIYSAEPG